MKKWMFALFVPAVLALTGALLAGCGAKSSSLNVEMTEFGFTPDRLTVKAGAPVTIHLKNSGALEHDFMILERDAQVHAPFAQSNANIYWQAALDARQETTLQFTAPREPGEYPVVCGVAGHLEQNMRATLVVE